MLRRILQTVSFALLAAAPSVVLAASGPNAVEVLAVHPTRVADLVLLTAGFGAGLREGMICRVTRGRQEIAEVVLVGLRPNCSAALIMSVAPKQSIRPGDAASIKVLKS
jgi:hypothetical protein